jgi:hypothetical protein
MSSAFHRVGHLADIGNTVGRHSKKMKETRRVTLNFRTYRKETALPPGARNRFREKHLLRFYSGPSVNDFDGKLPGEDRGKQDSGRTHHDRTRKG